MSYDEDDAPRRAAACDKLARSILRYLDRVGGKTTVRDILNDVLLRLDLVDEALESLTMAGRVSVTSLEGGGRTVELRHHDSPEVSVARRGSRS